MSISKKLDALGQLFYQRFLTRERMQFNLGFTLIKWKMVACELREN
jgi:hypothetical protein